MCQLPLLASKWFYEDTIVTPSIQKGGILFCVSGDGT